MQKICVIGSLNIDMTIALPRFHMPGETISGRRFEIFLGGKGGNQAVALAKLGKNPAIIAMVGGDAYGEEYKTALAKFGVNTDFITTIQDAYTGVAMIEIDESTGENRIALASGANGLFSPDAISRLHHQLEDYDIFLLQLEIPMETTLCALNQLKEKKKTIILDPAPATELSDEILYCADYLTPNETELSILSGMPTGTITEIERAAKSLRQRGAKNVVVKMGAKGSMLVTDEVQIIPPFSVTAVDTTAAGDSFNAGFACALSDGMNPAAALRFANATGALATTGFGAQSAMPDAKSVCQFMGGDRR